MNEDPAFQRPAPATAPSGRRGRFAPSPTGPLHFGSLVAALGSCLDARAAGGEWLLRIEDVDAPRCSPAAADAIQRTLEAFGFTWDGPVVRQSRREDAYAAALERLRAGGAVFPCACSRRELADAAAGNGIDGAAIYPGTCRNGLPLEAAARAWRLRVGMARSGRVGFTDRIQGRVESDLARDVGDFVLRRADGLFAYQLAVVVDDADAGITHVVRGADLLDSTPRQIFLQSLLGLTVPEYAHLPVVLNCAGEKLSKQTRASAVDDANPLPALFEAMRFLGQIDVGEPLPATLAEFWPWAVARWAPARVPRLRGRIRPV